MVLDPDSEQSLPDARPEGLYAPDRHAFAVNQPVNGKLTLMLVDVRDTTRSVVINPPDKEANHAAWSPDSKQIAFTAYSGGIYNIYLAQSDGSGVRNLTNSQAQDDFAAWSPDGTAIAFRSNRIGSVMLWLTDPDGSNLRSYYIGGGPYLWSPDGTHIATQAGPNRIQVVALASGNVATVAGGNVSRSNPTWSPDSQWLAYLEGGRLEGPPPAGAKKAPSQAPMLVKMRPDGTERIQVTPRNLPVSEARWSPDADRIALTSGGHLYLMNGDGSGLHAVPGANGVMAINWVCPSAVKR
jgi:Tol biopolymer transport system component